MSRMQKQAARKRPRWIGGAVQKLALISTGVSRTREAPWRGLPVERGGFCAKLFCSKH